MDATQQDADAWEAGSCCVLVEEGYESY